VRQRVVSIVLACTVMAAVGVFAGAAQAQTGSKFSVGGALHAVRVTQGAKSDSGRIAKSDPSLFHLSGSKLTPVVVKLDYDAVGSYRGYLPGYAATSPGVTHESVKANRAAVASYGRYIGAMEDKARASMSRLIPGAKLTQSDRKSVV